MITVHLIIPTTTAFEVAEGLRYLEHHDLRITQSHLRSGPVSVESEFDEIFSGPAVVENALRAQSDGADAVVIVCMGDPALHAAREALHIPVLGMGETAMHYAAMLGHKFSILPTLARRRITYESRARLYGLEGKLASVRPTNIPVLDIEKDPSGAVDRLVECAATAVTEDGADVIILGCAGFKDMDRVISERLVDRGIDVPVIDPNAIAVLTAAALARVRLSHSKTAYPPPPPKTIKGYDIA